VCCSSFCGFASVFKREFIIAFTERERSFEETIFEYIKSDELDLFEECCC
jgi:hypothetical protein